MYVVDLASTIILNMQPSLSEQFNLVSETLTYVFFIKMLAMEGLYVIRLKYALVNCFCLGYTYMASGI